MNILSTSFQVASLLGVLAFSTGSVSAQGTKLKLKVEDAKFEDVRSPDFAANTKIKKWRQKEWLEMEMKFKIDAMRPERKDKTLPKLTVKWYVAVVNPNRGKGDSKYIRLTQEIEHVNIPVGEDIYSVVYISPSGVRRISNGGDRASKSLVFAVGGEFFLDGKAVPKSRFSSIKLKKTPWWESTKLAESKSIKLHNKNETPFKFMWWDRYAEIANEEGSKAAGQ